MKHGARAPVVWGPSGCGARAQASDPAPDLDLSPVSVRECGGLKEDGTPGDGVPEADLPTRWPGAGPAWPAWPPPEGAAG